MLKIVAILLMLNLANSQYWKNQNWQSSPAKILLPEIIQVLNSFRKTLKSEIENKKKISPIEEVKRNCWLLEKLSHRTGKHFTKHCMRQAIGQVTKKMTNRNDAFCRVKACRENQKHWKTSQLARNKMLKLQKQNARKHLQELEEMYKNIIMLKTHHKGLARLA